MSRPNLNHRGESVLRTLIETYLEAGEPVGSRLLAKRYPETLSSATIRSVLSDLEEEAMVAQPHTSAGRVPSQLGYRHYVNCLLPAPGAAASQSATCAASAAVSGRRPFTSRRCSRPGCFITINF